MHITWHIPLTRPAGTQKLLFTPSVRSRVRKDTWVYFFTPSIIQRVWGAKDTIRKSLGGQCGDLALIWRCLVSLSKIAIKTYHLWETTDFNNTRIINNVALLCNCNPLGLQSNIRSLQDPTTAKYVWVPLAPGTTLINMLLSNLQQSTIDPSSITFKDWGFRRVLVV